MIKVFSLIAILGVFLYLVISTILFSPPVWPSEAVAANISLNLIREGRLGTNLWGDMIMEAKSHVFWTTPGLFYILAGIFRLFGFSIEVQRYVSIISGTLFLIVFFFLGRLIVKNELQKSFIWSYLVLFGSCLLLGTDYFFLRASKISSPEIFVLLFGTLSLLVFYKIIQEKSRFRESLFGYLIVGLLCSLAGLSHIIGLVFASAIVVHLIYLNFAEKVTYKALAAFSLGVICLYIPWLFSIYSHLPIFWQQLALAVQVRELTPSYLTILFNSGSFFHISIMTLYLAVTLYFVFYFKLEFKKFLSLWVILIGLWLYVIFGKVEWLTVLPVPFVYLCLAIIATKYGSWGRYENVGKLRNYSGGVFFVGLFLVIIGLNISNFLYTQKRGLGTDDYKQFGSQLLNSVPLGKAVYLSLIPDPYYFFIQRNNVVYTFPALAPQKDDFLKVLSQTDYVLINANLERNIMGDLLSDYLNLNTLNKKEVSAGSYSAAVIELKPIQERKIPIL